MIWLNTAMNRTTLNLSRHRTLRFRQKFEMAEFFGFETRNKYEIASENDGAIGFAAEQQKGVGGFLLRQFLGHWRTFTLHFFNANRELALVANHPFRIWFQRLEIETPDHRALGAIQQRFSVLSKRFDVEDAAGNVLFHVDSPLWSPWTYRFATPTREVAVVRKRWSGIFSEGFSDRDNFSIDYTEGSLGEDHRLLVLAAALFIDLKYFERKARN